MRSSLSNITKADLERFHRLQELGCIVCRLFRNVPGEPADVHHTLDGGRRISRQATAPLCAWHHRGLIPDRMNAIEAREKFGPSKARHPEAFQRMYGDDQELLNATNQLLAAMAKAKAA